MSQAIDDVVDERYRQVDIEGWDYEHDNEHDDESLVLAAVSYALPEEHRVMRPRDDIDWRPQPREDGYEPVQKTFSVPQYWPHSWHPHYWKPKSRRRDLVRAAALIIAEIERLDRADA